MANWFSGVPVAAYFVLIGAVIAGAGSFFLVKAQIRDQAQAQSQVLEKSGEVKTLQEKLNATQDKLSNALVKLGAAQEELISVYSGGDSFCYLDAVSTPTPMSDPESMGFVLRQIGEHAVSDIRVNLLDGKSFGAWEEFSIPTLRKGDQRVLATVIAAPRNFNLYLVRISTRNGTVSQDIHLARVGGPGVNGRWAKSLRGQVSLDGKRPITRALRDQIAKSLKAQDVVTTVNGTETSRAAARVDVVDGSRVQFEITDPDYPKE